MESNEKTRLTSQVYNNYTSKSHNLHKKSISRVLWLAFVVTMPCLAPGMSFGYSGIVLDQLRLTVNEQSWFASLPSIMMPIGCLLSGPLIDKLGRKTALMVTNIPSFLGWFLLAQNSVGLYVLYAGQLLVGMSVGLSTTPATVYAAECITVNYTGLRGCFTIMTSIMLNFGMFLTYLLGSLLPACIVAYVASFVSFAALIFIKTLIPESPPWLFEQGRHGDAEFSQSVLRIAQPILQTSRAAAKSPAGDDDTPARRSKILDRLTQPDVYKPMVIMTTFLFFQQFSGSFVLTAYMIQLLRSLNVTVNNYLVTLLAGFTNLNAMILLSVLLTQSGFKQLSIVSCSGYSLSMVALAVFLYLGVDNEFLTNVVVIACVLSNMAMNGLGLRPIPYAMLGEVFPSDVAGVAGSMVACLSSIFNFVAIKMYPYMRIWLGPGVFMVYGVLALCTLVFVFKIVPDTKGKTIKEIGDDFLRTDSSTEAV